MKEISFKSVVKCPGVIDGASEGGDCDEVIGLCAGRGEPGGQ